MEVSSPPQGHTRPLEPATPSNPGGIRARKIQRQTQNFAPEPIPYGGTRTTSSAATVLQQGIEAAIETTRLTQRLLKEFAQATDSFSAQYTTQQEQLLAKEIGEEVGRSLVQYFKRRAILLARDDDPKTASNALETPSYADITRISSPKQSQKQPSTAQTKLTPTKQPQQQKSREDLRVLITVPSQVLLERENPYILRRAVAILPGIDGHKVTQVIPTRNGWSITTADIATKNALLLDSNRQALLDVFRGNRVAAPENWWTYAVPMVTSSVTSLLNPSQRILVDEKQVREEVLIQTGETPVRCNISTRGYDPMTGLGTWIISFKQEVRSFRLFGTSFSSSLIKKRVRIDHHSSGCQGYCNQARCQRPVLCQNCGLKSSVHEGPMGDACSAPTKCVNCHGNHRAGDEKCPAAPRSHKGKIIRPTAAQLRLIKQASRAVTAAARRAKSTVEQSPSSGTPSSSSNRGNGESAGIPSSSSSPSPSPSPDLPSNPRKRPGERVTHHEEMCTPSSSNRPQRTAGAATKNLNLAALSRKSVTRRTSVGSEDTVASDMDLCNYDDGNPDLPN